MASIADLGSLGIRSVRRKSPPVPSGTIASLLVVGMGAPLRKKPLTTSFSVPSPPTATTRGRDSSTARCAISVASRGRVVKATSYGSPLAGSQVSTKRRMSSSMLPTFGSFSRKATTSASKPVSGRSRGS